MPLEPFEPDALELRIAASTYLPPCPFCEHSAIMSSSVNRSPAFSREPVYQARIACTNHECNASVVANERTREEAQQHAIAQWSRRTAGALTDERIDDVARPFWRSPNPGDYFDYHGFARALLAAHPGQREPRGEVTAELRPYPDNMTPELLDVLGRPNFWCGPIAHEMRAAGTDIKKKAEDEQAHVLHWLVKLVLDHGAEWQKAAAEELRSIRDKANAARAGDSQ